MVSPLIWLVAAQAQPLVAIVVVDQEARESGYGLEIDGWVVDDALPVDVAEGESVSIVDPDGRTEPLDVAVGEAWEVTGDRGEAWMARLGEDVRTDLIAVRGSDEAIEALAESLGAEILVEGELTWLSADDILFDAPWVEDEQALAVAEVGLVPVEDDEEPADTVPTTTRSPGAPAPVATRKRLTTSRFAAPTPAAPTAAPTPPTPVTEAPGGVDIAVAIPLDVAPEPAPIRQPEPQGHLVHDEVALRMAYTGLFLCKDDVLWLDAAGGYAFRGINGTWSLGAPGVVRLTIESGEVLFRAAIDPDTGYCRDVWSPEETGDAMPEGYDRHPAITSKRKARPMQRGPEL